MRLFFALTLPENIIQSLQKLQQQIQENIPIGSVRWSLPEQMHLTMRFLGDSTPNQVAFWQQHFPRVVPLTETYQLTEIGVFPNQRNPSVLWAGITGALDPLHTLQRELESLAREAGYAPELRPFSPHVTLGRVSKTVPCQNMRIGNTKTPVTLFQFQKLILLQSTLRPSGSTYRTIQTS